MKKDGESGSRVSHSHRSRTGSRSILARVGNLLSFALPEADAWKGVDGQARGHDEVSGGSRPQAASSSPQQSSPGWSDAWPGSQRPGDREARGLSPRGGTDLSAEGTRNTGTGFRQHFEHSLSSPLSIAQHSLSLSLSSRFDTSLSLSLSLVHTELCGACFRRKIAPFGPNADKTQTLEC